MSTSDSDYLSEFDDDEFDLQEDHPSHSIPKSSEPSSKSSLHPLAPSHPTCGKNFLNKATNYIMETPFTPPDHCEVLKKAHMLYQMGKASVVQRGNEQHIKYYRDTESGILIVVAFGPRFERVKRIHGCFTKFLPSGFVHEKFLDSATIPKALRPFLGYIPDWVDNKAKRESFASLYKVFFCGESCSFFFFFFFFFFSQKQTKQKTND